MRWFKHLANSRNDPRLLAVRKALGEAGLARYFQLLEVVAEQGGTADKFQPLLNLKSKWADLEWLADELRISSSEMSTTLGIFAEVSLIDPKEWKKRVIFIPEMTELLDEWTKRRRPRASPEQLPSNSGSEVDERKDKETQQSQDCNRQHFKYLQRTTNGKLPKRQSANAAAPSGYGKYSSRRPDFDIPN